MFTELATLVKMFFNSLLGKASDPELELEQTYRETQEQLIQTRKRLARSIELSEKLTRKQEEYKQSGKDTAVIESDLQLQMETIEGLKKQLGELEKAVQIAYTKKQVVIARDKLSNDGDYRFALSNSLEKDVGTLSISKNARHKFNNEASSRGVWFVLSVLLIVVLYYVFQSMPGSSLSGG